MKSKDVLLQDYARRKTNNVLHLVLSIITGGFWVPVWILVAVNNYIERLRINARINKL